MEAKLSPRLFKIEHDANEYKYFIELVILEQGTKWVIHLGSPGTCLTDRGTFDYPGRNTQIFDTHEEAFEGWKTYIANRKAIAGGSVLVLKPVSEAG